jgi:hypothetical protein
MKFEATLLKYGPCIFVKIYEDMIVHNFDLTTDGVHYSVSNQTWEQVCQADAELVDLKDDDYGNVKSIVFRTSLYDFEIVPAGSQR